MTPRTQLPNDRPNGLGRPGADASPGLAPTQPLALTAREGEVAAMIARGLSNRRIADALAVSERTVEWHVGNVLRKLRLESRVQIAVWTIDERGEVAR